MGDRQTELRYQNSPLTLRLKMSPLASLSFQANQRDAVISYS